MQTVIDIQSNRACRDARQCVSTAVRLGRMLGRTTVRDARPCMKRRTAVRLYVAHINNQPFETRMCPSSEQNNTISNI